MRLLIISNCAPITTQGSGYVIVNFARGMELRGHDVKLVGPEEATLLPTIRVGRSLRLAIGMRQRAAQLARQFEPDIIEFYGAEAWLATDFLSRRSNRRFKIVAHSNGIEPLVTETLSRFGIPDTGDGKPSKWYQGRIRPPVERAFTHADAIVTVSQPEADYAKRRGFQPPERILAINNALPDEFLSQAVSFEREKIIGYCGSWLARKGTELLVKDLTAVLRQASEWRLHLVGVGEGFRAIDHFPEDISARIIVSGFIADKAEQRRVYQSWAIAVMPSIYESFGLVAAEAMSCGCALVASRTGFPATLCDGEEALILEQCRTPHLSNAVLRLIADEAQRRRIAEAGWERVQSLRWDDSIEKLESFYLQLAGHQRLISTVPS